MADAPELVSIQSPTHPPDGLSSTKSFRKSSQINSDKKDAETTHVGDSLSEKRSSWSGRKYWGLIVLACVIIAAVVGGGVGGALAVQHAKAKMHSDAQCDLQQIASPIPATVTVVTTVEASSTSATSSSSSSAMPSTFPELDPVKIEHIDISCPQQYMSSWLKDSFECIEETDVSRAAGKTLTAIISYTLKTCIDACSTWDVFNDGGERCYAALMEWDLSYAYQHYQGANCYLLGYPEGGTHSATSENANITSLVRSDDSA